MKAKNSLKLLIIMLMSLSTTMAMANMVANPATSTTQSMTTTTTTTDAAANADSEITIKVQQKLSANPALIGSAITPTTQGGVVILSGTAQSQQQVDQAISDAKLVPGVSQVRTSISIVGNPNDVVIPNN